LSCACAEARGNKNSTAIRAPGGANLPAFGDRIDVPLNYIVVRRAVIIIPFFARPVRCLATLRLFGSP